MASGAVEIFFFGLLCFIHRGDASSGNIDTVEIVVDSDHVPAIYTSEKKLIKPITGDIRFEGLTAGTVRLDRCFDDVTHLSEHVAKGNESVIHTGANRIRVLLPAGTLTVAQYYEDYGLFPGGRTVRVPLLTALLTEAVSEVNVTTNKKDVAKLQPSSWILIANVGKNRSNSETCGPGNSHFEHFMMITDASHIEPLCEGKKRSEDDKPNCTSNVKNAETVYQWLYTSAPSMVFGGGDFRVHVVDQVDCSSSQWP